MELPIFDWFGHSVLICVLVRPVIEDVTTNRQRFFFLKKRKKLYLSRNEKLLVINVNQYVISWCVRNGFCEGKMSKVIFITLRLLFCIH